MGRREDEDEEDEEDEEDDELISYVNSSGSDWLKGVVVFMSIGRWSLAIISRSIDWISSRSIDLFVIRKRNV